MKTSLFPLVLLFSFFTHITAGATGSTGIAPQGAVHKMLQGKWQVTVDADMLPDSNRQENAAPDEADFAVMTYGFFGNGVFNRTVQRGAERLEEQGTWELSEDGRHILLLFPGKSAVRAEIKYIEADEMVLAEFTTDTDNNIAQREVRQMYFAKI